ncbi:MAG: hypothetical protein LBP35_04415 [Candidatus Ancillula trichonymphae]|jgi:hypothetical protein|nr:hypothetical protein [Candidatus Ancillula trichonymphae]
MKKLLPITILVLFLAGCTEPVPKVVTYLNSTSPALTVNQEARIRSKILEVVQNADTSGDTSALSTRVTGPALDLRNIQLLIKRATGKVDPNLQIPDTAEQVIITNNLTWPRDVFVITNTTQDQQTERLLVIDQNSVREDYKLWGLVRLFTGVSLPSFEVANIGSGYIAPDDITLSFSPEKALQAYSSLLQSGAAPDDTQNFADDPLHQEIRTATASAASELGQLAGSQTQTFIARKDRVRAIRSAEGGALLVGQIDSAWTRNTGNGACATAASDAERAILGSRIPTSSITVNYINIVAIYIPPKTSGVQMKVVGAERYPVVARTN